MCKVPGLLWLHSCAETRAFSVVGRNVKVLRDLFENWGGWQRSRNYIQVYYNVQAKKKKSI